MNGQIGIGGTVEKRSVSRKHLVSYLRIYDNSTGQVIGHLADLSTQGLMLISGESVSPDRVYRLRIRLSSGSYERNELIFSATCCWSKKEDESDFFTSGFRIDHISQALKERIQSLLGDMSYN